MAAFFHSYVAAVYLTKGLLVVQAWIAKLMDPEADVGQQPQPGQSSQNESNNASGHAGASTSNPTGGSASSSASLVVPVSLVNQVAMKRGVSINYVATSEGQSHLPTWTVACMSKCLVFLPHSLFFPTVLL